MEGLFPAVESINGLEVAMEAKENQWDLKKIAFEAYEGDMLFTGQLDLNKILPTYDVNWKIEHFDLESFSARHVFKEKAMKGTLFGQVNFVGELVELRDLWLSPEGYGQLSITGGEFLGFDVLGTIAEIEQFRNLYEYAVGTTSFTDIRMRFSVKENKMTTTSAMIFSDDFTANAEGEYTFDGRSNYRLKVFLSPKLTEYVLSRRIRFFRFGEGKQLGPIPLLLSGSLTHPKA